jgi:hypothetical protein
MMQAHYDCLLYYGTEIPTPALNPDASPSHIVLQEYHPLVQTGLFQDYFPHSKRFLYWNPCKIWVGDGADPSLHQLPSKDYCMNWRTKTLNLETPKAWSYSIDKALSLLHHDGIDGLFVDDLDVLSADETSQTLALDLMNELDKRAQRPVTYFLNRGSFAWNKIKNIEAILLEGLYAAFPFLATASERAWLQHYLLAPLRLLKARRPTLPVFSLRYPTKPIEAPSPVDEVGAETCECLMQELQSLITKELTTNKQVDTWPQRYL